MSQNLTEEPIIRMKQMSVKFLARLKDIFLKPTILVLIIASFGRPIDAYLLSPLWTILQLEHCWKLSVLVIFSSVIIGYYGWQMFQCKYDKKHVNVYVLAWMLYALYYREWIYIKAFSLLDCWTLILLAFPIGVCVHWLYRELVKQNEPQKNIVDVPPIILIDDNPIHDFSEDEFRYGAFAQRVARTITNSTGLTSYSLGITGIWGAGKTSMLNLLKRHLENNNLCIVVDFNPRRAADVKFIQHDFLAAICSALKTYHTGASHVMTDYMKALQVLSKGTSWSKVFDLIRTQDIDMSRKAVEKMIHTIGKKIVVIIDDFDRLTGEEIVEVLKVIGNNGSFERTFFVSAYDKDYVNQVLKAYFHETTERDYTDKYFNLELRLPDRKQFYKNGYLQKRMYALRTKGIIKGMSQKQIDDALMPVVGLVDSYLSTPRDIKRYIGLVMASFVEIQENVSLRDFLLLGLVKYKYPQEYDNLYKHLYFKQNPFGNSADSNFVLKDAKELPNVMSLSVLNLMFPSTGIHDVTDKQFGYKHLSWKRSFDYYFFDQELGHIAFKELIPLADPNISIEDFRKTTQRWNTEYLKKDVADFVISRATMVHSEEDFKQYLRFSAMARYLCPTRDLYIHCIRLLVKNNLDENTKDFRIDTETYTQVIDNFICKGYEWGLSAILLQDALSACLKPGEELELVFSHTYLQSVAEDSLRNVVKTFEAERATTEDVYELLKANIVGVRGDGSTELKENALVRVKNSMTQKAKLYFKDIVWHKPDQGHSTGIIIGMNDHIPVLELFKNKDSFAKYLQDVDNIDASLRVATSCLFEIYERLSQNHFKPFYVSTKQSNKNIRQCDYQTYNLIFEGER